jgi:hypothetical protein
MGELSSAIQANAANRLLFMTEIGHPGCRITPTQRTAYKAATLLPNFSTRKLGTHLSSSEPQTRLTTAWSTSQVCCAATKPILPMSAPLTSSGRPMQWRGSWKRSSVSPFQATWHLHIQQSTSKTWRRNIGSTNASCLRLNDAPSKAGNLTYPPEVCLEMPIGHHSQLKSSMNFGQLCRRYLA